MLSAQSRMLLYRTEDGRTRIEVRVQDETVWMTQATMAELFQSTKENISLHLKKKRDKRAEKDKRAASKLLSIYKVMPVR